jgi:glycosyl transferase family 25
MSSTTRKACWTSILQILIEMFSDFVGWSSSSPLINLNTRVFPRSMGTNPRPAEPYWSNPRRSHLGGAEIGCLLSHANAWRLIAQADREHGLVLEDDIHVCADFGDLIRGLSRDKENAAARFPVAQMVTEGLGDRRPASAGDRVAAITGENFWT